MKTKITTSMHPARVLNATPFAGGYNGLKSSPNQGACRWINLLARGMATSRWRHADSVGEALDVIHPLIGETVASGFGACGLFEFGVTRVRNRFSGWNRPLNQMTTLSKHHTRAIEVFADECRKRGLGLHGYIGTLDKEGYDLVPDATSEYLNELEACDAAGFDRIYFDASSWNDPDDANYTRAKRVGGGRRRDGMLAIRNELHHRDLAVEVGLEAWPRGNDGSPLYELGPALITGMWVSSLIRQGKLVPDSFWAPEGFVVCIFNTQQDATDMESLELVANRGVFFDQAGYTKRVSDVVNRLNAIAHRAHLEREPEVAVKIPEPPTLIVHEGQ